ncbi:MAG: transposase [Campylobacterota bacterium]|nr:transposase [Campylobacterota bacterium]
MARRPRIEVAGYYHIVNRGVEQRVVFKEAEDYEYFEELMCFYAKSYGITIHNYCLMSNHYHLLIEIQHENLSKFMRQINANYAIYFNKKQQRSGHLWQGRFKSWHVTDEAYLYTLILYIEQNPLKAHIVQELEAYPYSSYNYFLDANNIPECLQESWIVQNFLDDTEAIKTFLNSTVDTSQLDEMRKASSLVEASNTNKKLNEVSLRKKLEKTKDTKSRNKQIAKAYAQGYSQHMIAKVLELNQSTVQRIIKRSEV